MGLYLEEKLSELDNAYNPDNDVIPNTPRVTYTDYVLLEVIQDLLERVDQLEKEIKTLKEKA